MKHLVLMAAVVYFGTQAASAQQGAVRTMSVPGLTVEVRLESNYAGIPMLSEIFSTSDPKASVYCRSGFFDIRYVLRDSAGRVVTPQNRKAYIWGHDIPMLWGDSMLWTQKRLPFDPRRPDRCPVPATKDERRVLLSDLYPGLPRGMYSLQMTLAPVERKDRDSSAPILIKM